MHLINSRRQRGTVLVLTLFFLIVLGMLGTGFLALLPVEMKNAHKDRSAVQSGYGADAGVHSVMSDLRAGIPWDSIVTGQASEKSLANGWSYRVESIEALRREQFRVVTAGLLRGVVQRRAVAIIDGSDNRAFLLWDKNLADVRPQDENPDGQNPLWIPTGVKIKGDVLVLGHALIDNTGFDMNPNEPDPPFEGTIYHTTPLPLDSTAAASRGEEYKGLKATTDDHYAALYGAGRDGIQEYPIDLQKEDSLLSTDTQKMLLSKVFDEADGDLAQRRATGIPHSTIYHAQSEGGVLTGGIYLNAHNRQENFEIVLDTPKSGGGELGRTTVKNGTTTTVVTAIEKGVPFPANSGPTYEQDRLVIETFSSSDLTKPLSAEMLEADLAGGHVVYVEGEVNKLEGTFKGNRTIAVQSSVAITGELLKSDTPRGSEPTAASSDSLGIVGTVKPPDNAQSTDIKIALPTIPPTSPEKDARTYFIYAYLTGLDDNNTNNKMFQKSSVPEGYKVSLMGSLQIASTNSGLAATTQAMIGKFSALILDPLRPYGFPGSTNFIPQLRSYVDVPVGE